MPDLSPDHDFINALMVKSLEEARLASTEGEVPIGAAIGLNREIIASAHNRIEQSHNATAHAEIQAITIASERLKNWRLNEAILCVTLEPCTMCLGAIKQARIPVVAFGAGDSRYGAMGSIHDLSGDTRLGPAIHVIRGIMAEECSKILKDFFARRRAGGKL